MQYLGFDTFVKFNTFQDEMHYIIWEKIFIFVIRLFSWLSNFPELKENMKSEKLNCIY